MKRFYECTFIVNSNIDDAQIEGTIKAAQEAITKNGGQIASIEHIGRRRLAYPIAKKHNGYYATIEFEAESNSIERIERHLTLDENILRYLTLQLDLKELEAKKTRAVYALAASSITVDESVEAVIEAGVEPEV